jgi:hypothetical protein
MSEVYSDWYFFKSPCPLSKGGLRGIFSGFNKILVIIEDAGVQASPLWKGEPGWILDWTIFLPTGTY